MDLAERLRFEKTMTQALQILIDNPDYGGRLYSLTPGNPNLITQKQYRDLVEARIMFRDMDADPHLKSAGYRR